MPTYVKMIVVLSLITLVSGLALGALNEMTYEQAENNILKFKKIPAVASIYTSLLGSEESKEVIEEKLLKEKISVDLGGETPELIFVIKKDGKPHAITLERFGQGFGGSLGVITGFLLETGQVVGIGITTMSETPGVGTRVTEAAFVEQFSKITDSTIIKVKKDGGSIDAIAGATISSRAVAFAAEQANIEFKKHKDKIIQSVNQ